MDIDDLFDTTREIANWRTDLTGDALKLCEAVEARIEETNEAPSWTKLTEALKRYGVTISAGSVGLYYRQKYPHLRKRR